MCLGDIDNDGDLDFIGGHCWYENSGDPAKTHWNKHVIDPEWAFETQVELADLNCDGRIDVVLTEEECQSWDCTIFKSRSGDRRKPEKTSCDCRLGWISFT